jgi:hypothetical protein
MSERLKIRWNDIGSPTEPGLYDYQGQPVRVARTHIEAAKQEDNPICVMVRIRPFVGRESYALSSIVAEPGPSGSGA